MKKTTSSARVRLDDLYFDRGIGQCSIPREQFPVPPHAAAENVLSTGVCEASCDKLEHCRAYIYDAEARRCMIYFTDFAHALEDTPGGFTLADNEHMCALTMLGGNADGQVRSTQYTHVPNVEPACAARVACPTHWSARTMSTNTKLPCALN